MKETTIKIYRIKANKILITKKFKTYEEAYKWAEYNYKGKIEFSVIELAEETEKMEDPLKVLFKSADYIRGYKDGYTEYRQNDSKLFRSKLTLVKKTLIEIEQKI